MALQNETAPAMAADDSPLTLDQAVDLFSHEEEQAAQVEEAPVESRTAKKAKKAKAPPEPLEDDIPPVGEAEDDADEIEDSEADPQPAEDVEDESTEANVEDDEAEQDEPEIPAIDPPQFWDAEGKDSFAKLSAEAQQAVVRYEKQRTAAVAKAMQESTETRKTFDAKRQQLETVNQRIGEYVDSATERMTQWDEYWTSNEAEELSEVNPGQYNKLQHQYRNEVRAMQKAQADAQTAQQTLLANHTEEQRQLLPQLAPELADPTEGPKRLQEVLGYIRSENIAEAKDIPWITAKQVSIAWKALQYDKAQASAKKAAAQPRKPKPAGPTAKPAGQGQRPSSSETRLKQLQAKENPSIDDIAEQSLLEAQLRK